MDVAVQICLFPATHTIPDTLKNARRYLQGDLVRCWLAGTWETLQGQDYVPDEPITSNRTGMLYIRDMSDLLSIEYINEILSSCISEHIMNERDELEPVPVRRRKFRLDLNRMNNPTRNALLEDRYITISWNQAKNLVNKKVVLDAWNQLQDDESTQIDESGF